MPKKAKKMHQKRIPGLGSRDSNQRCLHYHATLMKTHQDSSMEEYEGEHYLQSMLPAAINIQGNTTN